MGNPYITGKMNTDIIALALHDISMDIHTLLISTNECAGCMNGRMKNMLRDRVLTQLAHMNRLHPHVRDISLMKDAYDKVSEALGMISELHLITGYRDDRNWNLMKRDKIAGNLKVAAVRIRRCTSLL